MDMEDLVNTVLNNSSSIATKNGFIGMCSNCKKTMKNPTVFNKHIKTQKCISVELRTYCSVCDIVLDGRDKYNKHLLSIDHFNIVVAQDIPTFDIDKVRKMNDGNNNNNENLEKKKEKETLKTLIDPFLCIEDKNKIVSSIKNKNGIGEGMVICFKNEGNVKVNFNFQKKDERLEIEKRVEQNDIVKTSLDIKIENDIDTIIKKSDNLVNNISNEIKIIPPTVDNLKLHNKKYEMSEGSGSDIGSLKDFDCVDGSNGSNGGSGSGGGYSITERQMKILGFLKGLVGVEGSNSKFLVALNKLTPVDYNGLAMAIIQCDEIPILDRQNYINVIRKYKELLQKKLVSGKPTHNGYDINMVLKNLSF